MYETVNVTVHALSETLSPLSHMSGTVGNEAVIKRERVITQDGLRDVPVISGNAIRHRCVREPGAKYLIGRYNLRGKLNIDQLNYLFNGGSLSESSPNENMPLIAEMQEALPLMRLLGGSLRNQVVGGSLQVMRGIMVCEETRAVIERQLPDGFQLPDDPLKSSEEYVAQYQYTRGDARRRNDTAYYVKQEDRETLEIPGADGFTDDVPGEKSNLMIYSGQHVIAGALFHHGFVMTGVSPVEVGALVHALHRWQETGGTIGGSARVGHGKLNTYIWTDADIDINDCVSQYLKTVDSMRERATKWLDDAFPMKKKAGAK